jgi:hypothetical protein
VLTDYGYDDDLLVAAEGLVSRPGFWAAYLMWLSRPKEGEVPKLEWFGADAADTDAVNETLMDEERWPVFRIPFGVGHTAVVLSCNLADDAGTDYFITHPDWGRHGYLATIDGHQSGPGLSWQELVHIAHTPDPTVPGVHPPNARLLLLLPALGDADLPADAANVVCEALLWAGAPAGEAPRVAESLLLGNPLWAPAHWTPSAPSPLSGSEDEPFTGILCCDQPGSPRYALRLAQGITHAQSDLLAHALGTWPIN